jgi:hypothetical protein
MHARHRTRRIPGLLAVALMLVLAACGGQGAPAPAEPASPNPTTSQQPVIRTPIGRTYWMAPRAAIPGISAACSDDFTGEDKQHPWCTPSHRLAAGDRIVAVPSDAYGPIGDGDWGVSGYTEGGDLAWLTCERPFECKIAAPEGDAIKITESGWGLSGWVVSAPQGSCVVVTPMAPGRFVHHVAVVNSIVGPCANNGINTFPYLTSSGPVPGGVDYLLFAGNLVRDAASGPTQCYSGISIYEPRNRDQGAGAHIVIARNISWANVDSPDCPTHSDGQGIILDDTTGEQSNYSSPYTGLVLIEENLLMQNGAAGVAIYSSDTDTLVQFNTVFGGFVDPQVEGAGHGLISVSKARRTRVENNLVIVDRSRTAAGQPLWAISESDGDASNTFAGNVAYTMSGQSYHAQGRTLPDPGASRSAAGLSLPTPPSALPDCAGQPTTRACLSDLLQGFALPAAQAKTAGVQGREANAPVSAPAWVCALNIPAADLVYCGAG